MKVLVILLFFSTSLFPRTAEEIIREMDSKIYGTSSVGQFQITVHRSRFTRTILLNSWEDRNVDSSFMKILSPKKDSGITFLKIKNNLWQYIPKIGKEIKIEGSLMQDSWMGSDFSNDDLVKSSSIVNDYTHTLLPSDKDDEYKLELKPKPTAPVTWSRLVFRVTKKDLLPVEQLFYDHKNRLSRKMEYSEYKTIDGKLIPTFMKMSTINNDKVTSVTDMRYLKIKFNAKIPASKFSKANLRR